MIPAKTHRATPGQTVGPFFAYGLEFPKQHEVVFPHSPGAIVLSGTVYDGAGAPIPDALVEIMVTAVAFDLTARLSSLGLLARHWPGMNRPSGER